MSAEQVTTYCPACGKTFTLPAELNGKKILCKGCQTHFIVQADKPGVPAAAPPPPAKPPAAAAPPATVAAPAAPVAAPAKALAPMKTAATPAPAPPPPVAAATAAPAPTAPVSADLPSIPFDDVAVPLGGGDADAGMPTVFKPKAMEKVKIESKGPYMVVKLVTTGKMVHVSIENALNDYATDGWRLQEIITVAPESYAILHREGQPSPPASASKD